MEEGLTCQYRLFRGIVLLAVRMPISTETSPVHAPIELTKR